jgi:ribosomal protein S18 acetylase RimI-like enzyme
MEKNPSVTVVSMASRDDLWQIRELALRIFPFTYQDIVEGPQIDYMMDMFYSSGNLIKQFESGQNFLIIYYDGNAAGYASYTLLNSTGDYKLNKIYLDLSLQGKGLGKILLREVISRLQEAGGRNLQLNVNRFNKAVGFYRNMGFIVKKEELLDIGNGYFMDDYVMELNLNSRISSSIRSFDDQD